MSRQQLRGLGLTDRAIAGRLASGRLHPVYRGVFGVGHHAIGRPGYMLGAVLACGDGTVVSHRTAAELLGLYDRVPVVIDVIAAGQSGRRLQGIRWHRTRVLEPSETTVHDGIPCTTHSRTLVDLAGILGKKSLRRAVEAAAVLRQLDVHAVDRILARGPRRGAPQLREILKTWRIEDEWLPRLRSGLEAWLLSAVVEAGLPRPQCNIVLRIDGQRFEVDLLWPEQRLAIETDGEETHGTRVAFNRDRRRDQVLIAAGYRPARVTWRQMKEEPAEVLDRIRRMLYPAHVG